MIAPQPGLETLDTLVAAREAKERGAKVIHVDPRFSRTSAMADEHIAVRAGADNAFVGGLIHQVLERADVLPAFVAHAATSFSSAVAGRRGSTDAAPRQASARGGGRGGGGG